MNGPAAGGFSSLDTQGPTLDLSGSGHPWTRPLVVVLVEAGSVGCVIHPCTHEGCVCGRRVWCESDRKDLHLDEGAAPHPTTHSPNLKPSLVSLSS